MPKKLTTQYVRSCLEEHGFILLSEYINSDHRIKIKCPVGHIFEALFTEFKYTGFKCKLCTSKPNKYDLYNVKLYVEEISNSGCKLLSEEYISNKDKLDFECSCGNKFTTNFNEFKNGNPKKQQCNECGFHIRGGGRRLSYEHIRTEITNMGIKLLSEYYENSSIPLKVECNKGHIFYSRFHDLHRGHGCPECSEFHYDKLPYEFVSNYFEKHNYKLLSTEYQDTKSKLLIKCPKEHEFKMAFGSFKDANQRCPECYRIALSGLTPITTTLRSNIVQWKKDSVSAANYRCIISNEKIDDIHHIYSFNQIFQELMIYFNFQNRTESKDFSDVEIEQLKIKNIELHYKYGLGAPINRKLHRLFHSLYGKINATPEDFYEFKKRYDNGEFTSLLSQMQSGKKLSKKIIRSYKLNTNQTKHIKPNTTNTTKQNNSLTA